MIIRLFPLVLLFAAGCYAPQRSFRRRIRLLSRDSPVTVSRHNNRVTVSRHNNRVTVSHNNNRGTGSHRNSNRATDSRLSNRATDSLRQQQGYGCPQEGAGSQYTSAASFGEGHFEGCVEAGAEPDHLAITAPQDAAGSLYRFEVMAPAAQICFEVNNQDRKRIMTDCSKKGERVAIYAGLVGGHYGVPSDG